MASFLDCTIVPGILVLWILCHCHVSHILVGGILLAKCCETSSQRFLMFCSLSVPTLPDSRRCLLLWAQTLLKLFYLWSSQSMALWDQLQLQPMVLFQCLIQVIVHSRVQVVSSFDKHCMQSYLSPFLTWDYIILFVLSDASRLLLDVQVLYGNIE